MVQRIFNESHGNIEKCCKLYAPVIVTSMLTIGFGVGLPRTDFTITLAFALLTLGFLIMVSESKRRWQVVADRIERNQKESRKGSNGDQHR